MSEQGIFMEEKAESQIVEVIGMVNAERFAVLLKNGKRAKVACWVNAKKKNGEIVITAAFATETSGGNLLLSCDCQDVDRIIAI